MKVEERTTYTPESLEAARREEERRLVREGTEIWRARKEEALRQKHRDQSEVWLFSLSLQQSFFLSFVEYVKSARGLGTRYDGLDAWGVFFFFFYACIFDLGEKVFDVGWKFLEICSLTLKVGWALEAEPSMKK